MKKRQRTGVSQTQAISIRAAARRAAVDGRVVHYCVEVGLLKEGLTEADVRELRRIRRLMSLGVNLEGAEIILRMRRRIQELEAELARLRRLQC
jgi:DNA-binding transcriptional MerR regulator